MSVNGCNLEGNTPIFLAHHGRKRNLFTAGGVEFLLMALGADTSAKNVYGMTYKEGLRPGD